MDDIDVLKHFDLDFDETAFQEAVSNAHALLLGNDNLSDGDFGDFLSPSGSEQDGNTLVDGDLSNMMPPGGVNQDIPYTDGNSLQFPVARSDKLIEDKQVFATGGAMGHDGLIMNISPRPSEENSELVGNRLSTSSSSDDPDNGEYEQFLEQIQEPQGVCMNRKEKWALNLLRDWWKKTEGVNQSSAEKFLKESPGEQLDLMLSSFMTEVRMKKDRKYQTETLRQMLMAIQRFMRRCGRYVSFLSDPNFILLQGTLALENAGHLEHAGIEGLKVSQLITADMENLLWEKKLIGNHNPQTLLDSQFILFGLYFGIWSGQQHRNLKHSKIKLLKNALGHEFLRYCVEVTRKGGRFSKKNSHVPEHYDVFGNSDNPDRNIVELYKEYNYRCPSDRPEDAYYLQPISNPTDDCWFLNQPVGKNSLSRATARLAKAAGFVGEMDNTSLKITCGVRMVQNGTDLAIVKILTGLNVDDLRPYVTEDALLKAGMSHESGDRTSKGLKEHGVKREADNPEGCIIPMKNFKAEKDCSLVVCGLGTKLDDPLPSKLVVTSVVDCVYMDKPKGLGPVEPPSYRGFIPDLLHHLSNQVGFEYEIQTSQDGTYAPLLDNGEWGGMVADLRNRAAHVACGPLTIMAAREEHVDFTHPFMSMGLSIIYKRPVSSEQLPFTDLESLINSGIRFGIVHGCAFHIILKRSTRPLYEKMIRLMDQWGDQVYVSSLVEAIDKVRTGNYAFLGDYTCADLFPDELIAIGPRYLSQMFYAFATPKGSPLCRVLGRAIMEMAEGGTIEELYDKWCKHRGQ